MVSGKTRRFLVFYGNYANAEPLPGGWQDYFRSFDQLTNATREVERLQRDYPDEVEWWHIVDLNTTQIVAEHTDGVKV